MLEGVRQEWHCFRDAEPGTRFLSHHRRAHRSQNKAKALLRIGFGALLFAAGIVMLFIPGPGLLGMLFGVALIAGESKRLASVLDRGEMRARRAWKRTSQAMKISLLASGSVIAVAVTLFMAWRWLR
jgi:hypothetical protein